MRQKTKLAKLIQVWGILIIVVFSITITIGFGFYELQSLDVQSKKIRDSYVDQQKELIKTQVKNVVTRVILNRQIIEDSAIEQVKNEVYVAYGIAEHIFLTYKNSKSESEILEIIIEALRPIRFNNGNGYIFINDLNGEVLLYPTNSALEGRNLWDLQDNKGQNVVQEQSDVCTQEGEGFVVGYWPKPDNDRETAYEKISFIKYFEPYDLYFGAGVYVDEVEKVVEDELLKEISGIRFGTEGYIFVNRLNGDALLSNGQRLTAIRKLWEGPNKPTQKIKDIFKMEYDAAIKPDGDFIYYTWQKLQDSNIESPKVSFISGIPDIDWLIGAGVYLDDIEIELKILERQFIDKEIKNGILVFVITFISIITFLIFLKFLENKLNDDFKEFSSFLQKAAYSAKLIDTEKIKYYEFEVLANNANQMLEDKIELQEQLNHRNKMDAIGQLAGGVAHDFNNMLGGIMGATQLLRSPKRNLDNKSLEYVKIIDKATSQAADLTANLLAFGRKGKKELKNIDIHTILDDTLSIISKTIDRKITISVVKDAENSFIIGDESSIQNSLMNLAINASNAMKTGGTLSIKTQNKDIDQEYCEVSSFEIKAGKYIEIAVRDTGCGIEEKNIKKIFEPFFTTKEQGEGTGLGLSSVYGTIQDHNGAIYVSSEIGIGTVLRVLLPITYDETAIELSPYRSELSSGTGKILLIDDEKVIRMTSTYVLEEMGYEVLAFENGLEAIIEFEKKHSEIDIIITDMIMPKISGKEIFYKLRNIDKNCKVILSSGFTTDTDLNDLKRDGLAGFISKPFQFVKLSQLIEEILKNEK